MEFKNTLLAHRINKSFANSREVCVFVLAKFFFQIRKKTDRSAYERNRLMNRN